MLNIHVYPSLFLNESRILRTAEAIERLDVFSEIELVGIASKDNDCRTISDKIKIRRFKRTFNSIFSKLKLIRKLFAHVFWLYTVFSFYKDKNIGCINAHSLTVLPMCSILKFFTGAKLVYDTHELEAKTNGAGVIKQFLSYGVEAFFIQFADYCVFVSSGIKEWYERKYNIKNAIVILNCPIVNKVVKNNSLRDFLSIPNKHKIFLYQGVLSYGRGVELLIKTFSSLNNKCSLVFMGYGSLENVVREAAAEYSNIYFKEAVSPDTLLHFTASADVGLSIIFPTSLSYQLCMPNKLFEYINAGLPVLVSPTIEQKIFVESNQVGSVLKELNQLCLQEEVSKFLETIDDYLPAIKLASQRYNWSEESKKVKILYNSLFMRAM